MKTTIAFVILAVIVLAVAGLFTWAHFDEQRRVAAADASWKAIQQDGEDRLAALKLTTLCVKEKGQLRERGDSWATVKHELAEQGFNLDCTAKAAQ
jgi:type VI protein secretion system component VasK